MNALNPMGCNSKTQDLGIMSGLYESEFPRVGSCVSIFLTPPGIPACLKYENQQGFPNVEEQGVLPGTMLKCRLLIYSI